MWTSHPDLIEIIKDSWTRKSNILDVISTFQKTPLGIYSTKKIIKRIEGIQNSPMYAYNTFLRNLENELLEYSYIHCLEEEFLKRKSRVNWLNGGMQITSFTYYNNK